MHKKRGDRLRFGLVGAGRIASSYCDAFSQASNAELVCVADCSDQAAAEFAARCGCAPFRNHHELAASGLVHAAIVATPPNTHAEICLDLIEAGIPVLCEKPVSLDGASARAMRERSQKKGVPLTMASKFRYADDVMRAHAIVQAGTLGRILLFENTFMSAVPMKDRWNSVPAVSGGGVLIDNGTHSVDIMRYFLGPLTAIHVVGGSNLQGLAVEETVHVTARSEGQAIGRMDLSWSLNKQSDDYISVYGSRGTLRVGWKQSSYQLHSRRLHSSAPQVTFGNGYSKIQAFCNQIENFSASLQGLEKLIINADDAIASVDVVACGYRALATQSWVAIPQVACSDLPSQQPNVFVA